MKNIYKIPTANIHYDEKLHAFPPKTGIKERYLLSQLLFNIVLKTLLVQQERGIKSTPFGKEEIKLSLFAMT